MSEKPWTTDEETQKRTKRFGLVVLALIILMMVVTAVSRFYGW